MSKIKLIFIHENEILRETFVKVSLTNTTAKP
jgi:hypothetical protein